MVALMIGITAIYVVILKTVLGVTLSGIETRFLINMFVFDFIELVMFVTIASIFYFLSENAAVGLFAYLAFMQIIPATGIGNQVLGQAAGFLHFPQPIGTVQKI